MLWKKEDARHRRSNNTRLLNDLLTNKRIVGAILLVTGAAVFLLLNYCVNVLARIPETYQSMFGPGGMIGENGIPQIDRSLFELRRAFEFRRGWWRLYLVFLSLAGFIDLKILYNIYTNYSDLNTGQKGDERFATRKEIKKQYRSIPEKKETFRGRGGFPVAREKERIYIDDRDVNNVIIGMTRSGKGEMFVFPIADIYSRAKKQASLIFTDPKLELASGCIPALTKRGYECHVLNLIDLNYSMGYNPLTMMVNYYKRGHYDEAAELAHSFAFSIFQGADMGKGDPFWPKTATPLLSALIQAHIEDCLKEDEQINQKRRQDYEARKSRAELTGEEFTEEFVPTDENEKKINMYSIVKLFSKLSTYDIGEDKNLLDEYFMSRPDGNIAKLQYMTVEISKDRTKSSIYVTMLSEMNNFISPGLAKMTAESTLDLYDVGYGKKPVAVFIGMPDYDKSKSFLSTVFVTQLVYALAKLATASPTGKVFREVIFTLDEFGNMPKFENMKEYITMGAGRNIRFNLILQSYSQLYDKYGEHDTNTIVGNAGNQIYILTNDNETTKSFSELLGNETIISESRSGQKISSDKSVTESTEKRPLLTPNELMRLRRGECIVKRSITREDLKNRDIDQFPIANLGKYKMKYRWQFLADDFDPKRVLYRSPRMDEMIEKINEIREQLREDGEEYDEEDFIPYMDPGIVADVEMETTDHIDLDERSVDAGRYVREWKTLSEPMTRCFSQDELMMLCSQYLGLDRESRDQILQGQFTSKETLDFAESFYRNDTISKENYDHLREFIWNRIRERSRKGE